MPRTPNAIFGNLNVGDEFLYERDADQRGTLQWTLCRKIVSPATILGEDFADMSIILLGEETGLVDRIDDQTPVITRPKK